MGDMGDGMKGLTKELAQGLRAQIGTLSPIDGSITWLHRGDVYALIDSLVEAEQDAPASGDHAESDRVLAEIWSRDVPHDSHDAPVHESIISCIMRQIAAHLAPERQTAARVSRALVFMGKKRCDALAEIAHLQSEQEEDVADYHKLTASLEERDAEIARLTAEVERLKSIILRLCNCIDNGDGNDIYPAMDDARDALAGDAHKEGADE